MTTTLLLACLALASPADDQPDVVVAVGAAGDAEYGTQFDEWADRWRQAAERGHARVTVVGRSTSESGAAEDGKTTDHEGLHSVISKLPKVGSAPIWIVLIGHGTFDGREAKFNLRGPDLDVGELADWISEVERPLVIVNCSSASGPFVKGLSAKNRVVVTATRSGDEQNFARFGDYVSSAIADPSSDLDKDEQVSVLEAFLSASKRVEEFYKTNGRLSTEHALLDDNGDGLGTPADWFRGIRAVKRAKDGATADGALASRMRLIPSDHESVLTTEQRAKRDALETQLDELRLQKDRLDETEYYRRLQDILVELSRVPVEAIDDRKSVPAGSP